MERIHVIGLGPRTGTTLMAESMIACFAIDAFDAHESPLFSVRRNVDVYLSKQPGDAAVARVRLAVDRHFHVICMLRDPRDVITSRHGNDPSRYWAPLRMWKRSLRHVRHMFRHKRFILVRYEDLVARPDEVQDEIARRLPFLRQTGRFTEFHRRADPAGPAVTALGGVRAISTDSVGKWRQHRPRVAGQLVQHGPITAELIEFGYEKDDSWLADLAGIEPDLTPSFWADVSRPSLGWRLRRLRSRARGFARLGLTLVERLGGRNVG
jgi:hypothetical protein